MVTTDYDQLPATISHPAATVQKGDSRTSKLVRCAMFRGRRWYHAALWSTTARFISRYGDPVGVAKHTAPFKQSPLLPEGEHAVHLAPGRTHLGSGLHFKGRGRRHHGLGPSTECSAHSLPCSSDEIYRTRWTYRVRYKAVELVNSLTEILEHSSVDSEVDLVRCNVNHLALDSVRWDNVRSPSLFMEWSGHILFLCFFFHPWLPEVC